MAVAAASSRLPVGLGVAFVTGNVCGWAEAALMSAASANPRTFLGGRGGRGNAHERCFGPSLHIPRGNVNSDYLLCTTYYVLLTMCYLLLTTYYLLLTTY